jgi:hypothetical protein
MAELKESLRTVANEYARQTTRLLGLGHYEWVGEDTFGLCIIDEETYLTLEEMQVIIDDLDRWVSIYGTREKVAEVICEWEKWWQADADKLIDVKKSAVHEYFFPNINLRSWLMGLRPTHTGMALTEIKLRFTIAEQLGDEYGLATRLGDILNDLRADYNQAKAQEDAANAELREQLANGTAPEKMQRAYDEFKKVLDNNE